MMYTYIQKDTLSIYAEYDFQLDETIYDVGRTWDDYRSGKWVLLSIEQLIFRASNPGISVEEVFKMQLNPAPDPEPELTPEERFERARQDKISSIYQQDYASNVFYVQAGEQRLPMWLDKNTRNSLLNITLPAEKAAGNITTTLWYEGQPPVPVTVSIAWLEERLPVLELYAKQTYDLRNRNLAVVYTCGTIAELETLDVTADYPEPEVFELKENMDAEGGAAL